MIRKLTILLIAFALVGGLAKASSATSTAAIFPDHPGAHSEVQLVGGGSLELRQTHNPDVVELITPASRSKVLWGNLNGAIAVLGHDPAQG